jgi:ABC-2 type transport system ATP-binding protein
VRPAPTHPPAIRLRGLRKDYRTLRGTVAALDGLDLEVPVGEVHGFLGPNGAGKTTTFRLLLGLARPTGGTIEVFGEPVTSSASATLSRVGATVGQPGFTPGFSGQRNLRLLARAGGLRADRVREVLDAVNLTGAARTPYRRYSLGMRQRLAIAAALLGSPDLLLLDEPTNGLDPEGVLTIRRTISRVVATGTTVVLASHDLAEVQQVCDSVSIIGEGRLLASGTVEDLLGEQTVMTRVVVEDLLGAEQTLTSAGFAVTRDGDALLISGHDNPGRITRTLAEQGHYVSELRARQPDLASYYLTLTGHPVPQHEDDDTRGEQAC